MQPTQVRSFGELVMLNLTRTTDPKGRVSLPKAFANTTVIIEQVSDTELRIRKARIIPEADLRFAEESATPLSKRDRDLFLALLDNPPPPNEALRRAAAEYARRRRKPGKRRHG
jgi:hypothetical protein